MCRTIFHVTKFCYFVIYIAIYSICNELKKIIFLFYSNSSFDRIPKMAIDIYTTVVKENNSFTKKMYPGQKLRAGSSRKAPEIAETWKQYSHRFLLKATGN